MPAGRDYIRSIMEQLFNINRARYSKERDLNEMQQWTGGYVNPVRQMMFLRDFFRTGRIQDPFGTMGFRNRPR